MRLCQSLAEAGNDATDEGATARRTDKDPGDQVVDTHEVSRFGLNEETWGGVFGEGVTRGELSSGTESPDHTHDPGNEAGAGNTAGEEGVQACSKHAALGRDPHEESTEDGRGDEGDLVGKHPGEPHDEVSVDISDGGGVDSSGGCSTDKRGSCAAFNVPGGKVWVVEGVFA